MGGAIPSLFYMNIPECFKNLIALRDSCESAPKSGLYLDDLIDLALTTLSDISSNTGADLFNSIYKRSVIEVLSEIEQMVDNVLNIQLNNIISIENIGFKVNMYNPPTNANRGIYIQKRSASKMQRLYIDTVGILIDTTGSVTINVIDGSEIISKSVDARQGCVVDVEFKYSVQSDSVYIVANNNNINTAASTVKAPELTNYPCCGGCNYTFNKNLSIAGYDGNKYVDNTFGIFASVSLYCDKHSLYCALSDDIALPLLYKVAYNVSQSALQSQRINSNVNVELWSVLANIYKDKYEQYLGSVISRSEKVIKKIDPQCILCRGNKIINTHF